MGILGGLSRSGGTVGQSGGGLGAHLKRSGAVLGGLGAVWGRSWAILGRLGVVLSASGEATGDHDGSKRLKEDLLEAKNRPRRPAGGQDFSKKPFCAILWCILGACFCTFSAPKSVPKSAPFFDLCLAPFWSEKVAKIDPESLQHGTGRPEKAPR